MTGVVPLMRDVHETIDCVEKQWLYRSSRWPSRQIHQSAYCNCCQFNTQPCPADWWIWIDAHTSNAFGWEFCTDHVEKLVLQLQDYFSRKFWRDWGFTWHRHGDISGGSGASIFEVRNLTVWCQFQVKLDQVTCQKLIAACLVSFSMTHGSVYIFFKLLLKHLHWNLHFGANYSHPIVHLFFFYK